MRPDKKLLEGLKAAFQDKKRVSLTLLISTVFLILLALSTAVNYSFQMFSSGIEYWLPAVQLTVLGFYLNGGWTEVFLNITYSILVGIVFTNTYIQFRATGLEISNLSGIAPGVLVAGCAGCGVGLLSLIGLTGVVASLPLQGTGLKLSGILLIAYFIARVGDPETCSIPAS